MEMDFSVLQDIVVIFALSVFVNLIFTKIKIPTIIGYMVTGIIAGPHLLGLVSAQHEIELMAEIGVVLLMFTIGLEFSLQHLIKIRKVVFFGGLMQFALTTGIILLISRFYDLEWKSGLFIGFLTSLSSTAIVLKMLQERSDLTSNYGRTVLGILIFQDIMLVPLILFSNILVGDDMDITSQVGSLAIKTVAIIAFVYVGYRWLVPWLLNLIVHRRNQELFLMSIFLFCLAVALLTSKMGMSLAFGAFLAGLMISGSEYSHNTFGNLIPFKDTFTSFFFVSIGMLLDLGFVAENFWLVLGTLALVLTTKAFFAGASGFMLGHTFRGTVMVGVALSQVGEFSFILAKIGEGTSLLSNFYFQLFLAVAVMSMSLTPLFISLANSFADVLLRLPLPKFWVDGLFPLKEIPAPELSNHLVIIGKDIRARKLALLAQNYNVPHICVVFDPGIVREKQQNGEPVIYGDALNIPVLHKAYVERASIVVVSVGDIIASSAIVERIKELNPNTHILARAKYINDLENLYNQGASHVVPEKFETVLELFHQVLERRLMPEDDISKVISDIRTGYYGIFLDKNTKSKNVFLEALPEFEIKAVKVEDGSPVIDKSLSEIKLRVVAGVTLLAIKRDGKIIDHPGSDVKFLHGDYLYLLGKPSGLEKSRGILESTP